MKPLIAIVNVVIPVLLPLPVLAYEAGDWLVRGRVIHIAPNDDSGSLTLGSIDTGLEGVKVDSDTVPELDITYMLSRHWGMELILGYSEHTVKGRRNWSALGDVIDTKVLPPTLTLQYHFLPDLAALLRAWRQLHLFL